MSLLCLEDPSMRFSLRFPKFGLVPSERLFNSCEDGNAPFPKDKNIALRLVALSYSRSSLRLTETKGDGLPKTRGYDESGISTVSPN